MYFLLCYLVFCLLGSEGKPSSSLSFNLQSLASFTGLGGGGGSRDSKESLKVYSGLRVQNDSLRMVYFHDQTVAVVELGPKKLLLNCELIEVYEPDEAVRALGELQKISRPLPISFEEMIKLMTQCQQIDSAGTVASRKVQFRSTNTGRGILSNNPFTILSGIIPGTKWCGTGDIAENYHDLGAEASVDRCCRTHDLCPVKVRAYTKRYNLTNGSLYSKSHCLCDDSLYDCLKTSDSPKAHIMGNLYFNLIQVPCVMETEMGKKFRSARSNF